MDVHFARQEKAQIFDNPSDRKLIIGYLCGLVSALFLAFAALSEAGGGSRGAIVVFYLIGIGFLLPALFWSLLWRVLACFVAIALAIKYGLDIRDMVERYGLVKVVSQTTGEAESYYGFWDVLRPSFSCLLCILFATFVSYWDLQDSRQGRNFSKLFNGALSILLSIMAFSMFNYIVNQRSVTFDWTGAKLYTVSSESKAYLRTARKPVVMHIFMGEGSDRFAVIKRLAEQYQEIMRGRLEVKHHDPYKRGLEFQNEVSRLGLVGNDFTDLTCIAFETGRMEMQANPETGDNEEVWVKEQVKQVGVRDIFQVDMSTGGRRPIFKGEEAFTNAILELQGESKPKIYVLQGHGELTIGKGQGAASARRLVQFLRRRYYQVEPLVISSSKGIPEDCGVLIIPGARGEFTSSDRTVLSNYLAGGGRLFCFLEVIPAGQEDGLKPSSLAPVLEDYNIVPSRHLIIGRVAVQDPNNPSKPRWVPAVENLDFPAFNAEHPVTSPLLGGRLVASEARALLPGKKDKEVQLAALVQGGVDFDSVAVREPRAFSRRNYRLDPKKDMVRDFALALASEKKFSKKKRARLVVVGDAEMISDSHLTRGKNTEFVLNSLNWLLEKEGRFVAEAKVPPTWALDIKPGTRVILKLGALFVLPAIPLSIGLLMFFIRRR